MLEEIFIAILSLSLSAGIYFLLRKAVPLPPQKQLSKEEIKELRQQYRWYPLLFNLLTLVVMLVSGFLLFFLVKGLINLRFPETDEVYVIGPDPFMGVLVALFGSIVLTYWLYRGSRKYFPEDAVRFSEAIYNQQYRFDSDKVMRVFSMIVAPLMIIFTALMLNYYAILSPAGIRYSDFLDLFHQEYQYEEVQSITYQETFTAPNGNVKFSPHFIIEFIDGNTWNTRTDQPGDDYDAEEIGYIIQEFTELPIVNDPDTE